MIRIETIAPEPVKAAASNAPSNRIENVRRPAATSIRSTRESYNAYQRRLMAARRALAKVDQARLATAPRPTPRSSAGARRSSERHRSLSRSLGNLGDRGPAATERGLNCGP